VGSVWKVVRGVSDDSVTSFFVISVEGVMVGKSCYSDKYEVVLVDDVDSSVGNSNNYVGREYGDVCVVFVGVFRGVESVDSFL
jgi:hypothetical protein